MDYRKQAERFPEEYRERIEEMLRLRHDTNQMNAQAGHKVRVTVEDENNRLFEAYGDVPTYGPLAKKRTRNLDGDLATARRVNAKRRG